MGLKAMEDFNITVLKLILSALVVSALAIWGCWMHARYVQQEQEMFAEMAPMHVPSDALIQVVVHAKKKVAELEIQAGAFESFDELNYLVVNALPQL